MKFQHKSYLMKLLPERIKLLKDKFAECFSFPCLTSPSNNNLKPMTERVYKAWGKESFKE